jgi:hypothetical protein
MNGVHYVVIGISNDNNTIYLGNSTSLYKLDREELNSRIKDSKIEILSNKFY